MQAIVELLHHNVLGTAGLIGIEKKGANTITRKNGQRGNQIMLEYHIDTYLKRLAPLQNAIVIISNISKVEKQHLALSAYLGISIFLSLVECEQQVASRQYQVAHPYQIFCNDCVREMDSLLTTALVRLNWESSFRNGCDLTTVDVA